LDVPAYRPACSVYLFNQIRVRRGANPFYEKTVGIVVGGKTVRSLSLKEITSLPVDGEGYHVLTVRASKPGSH
jgi:hypothetical protein